MLVEVEDNTVARLRHVPLDVLRWTRVRVNCAAIENQSALVAAMSAALARHHSELSEGRPVVARVVIGGATALTGILHDRSATLRDEVRSLAAAIAPDLWIEKVQLDVTAPVLQAAAAAPDDFLALLAEAADAPELARILVDEFGPFLLASAKAGEPAEGDLATLAQSGDWPALVRTAGAALGARLSGAETS